MRWDAEREERRRQMQEDGQEALSSDQAHEDNKLRRRPRLGNRCHRHHAADMSRPRTALQTIWTSVSENGCSIPAAGRAVCRGAWECLLVLPNYTTAVVNEDASLGQDSIGTSPSVASE